MVLVEFIVSLNGASVIFNDINSQMYEINNLNE